MADNSRHGTAAVLIAAVFGTTAAIAEPQACAHRGQLDTQYCDDNHDLVADPRRFPPEMSKEFQGDDRFRPIDYLRDWAVVREIAEKSDTPYNKAAYDAEARREAATLSKKQPPAKQ
jgi:hypothetical protein